MDTKLSMLITRLDLKTLALSRNSMILIIDSVTIRHSVSIGTLSMHNLDRFLFLIDYLNVNEIRFLNFAIYKK